MKQLRAETISAVDGRLSALQAQVAEAVDTRVAAALLPLTARLERIELLLGLARSPPQLPPALASAGSGGSGRSGAASAGSGSAASSAHAGATSAGAAAPPR